MKIGFHIRNWVNGVFNNYLKTPRGHINRWGKPR